MPPTDRTPVVARWAPALEDAGHLEFIRALAAAEVLTSVNVEGIGHVHEATPQCICGFKLVEFFIHCDTKGLCQNNFKMKPASA